MNRIGPGSAFSEIEDLDISYCSRCTRLSFWYEGKPLYPYWKCPFAESRFAG